MKNKLLGLLALTCVFSLNACNKGKEAPKAEAPKAEAPKAEAPKAEAVKAEAVKAEAVKAEAVKAEADSKAPVVKKRVYFTSPNDNAELKSPVKVVFGLDGMSIRPAGEDVNDTTSGHHHLIIDSGAIPSGQVVPMDKQHIHYGKGQTSATIELTPGKHTLRLQFANGAHLSYGPEMSSEITVNVVK